MEVGQIDTATATLAEAGAEIAGLEVQVATLTEDLVKVNSLIGELLGSLSGLLETVDTERTQIQAVIDHINA